MSFDFEIEFSDVIDVPTSAGKGGGKVNELLNAYADFLMGKGNAMAAKIVKSGNENGSTQVRKFPPDLTAQQIAGKVNDLIATANGENADTYPWYLIVRNRNEDGSDALVETTVQKHDKTTEQKIVANGLYLLPGVKPVRTRKSAENADDTQDDTEAAA